MHKTFRVLIGCALLCLTCEAQAQSISNSPYSRYGLGEINENLGNVRNAGMAGAGISAANSYQANTANPALLYYNSITVFDMSVRGQVKTIENASQSQRDGNANLSNLSLVVPITKRWSSALSLRPYSAVDYQVVAPKRTISSVDEPGRTATEELKYQGEGGISELNFGHGIRITKGLTVGASASFLFGTITKESSSLIEDTDFTNQNIVGLVYSERTRYSDLLFRAGINYRKELKDKLNLSAGGVYTFGTELDGKRTSFFERRTTLGNTVSDTILSETVEGTVNIPQSWQAGISIDNGSNLTVSADMSAQKWSEYRGLNNVQDDKLADSYRMALGAEWTPDANAIDSYFKRITYRAGLYHANAPYKINGEQIKDNGVTAGFTFPIGRSSIYDLYQLNTSIGYGSRGTTELVKEKYFQFSAGFTINSRWFIKRRIE